MGAPDLAGPLARGDRGRSGRLRRASSPRLRASRLRFAGDTWLVCGSVVAFIGMTIWWLSQDDRVQDWDNGLHTLFALTIKNQLAAGNFTAPFTDWNTYPPFGHIIGALGIFIGGFSPASVILASNVFFVPILAASCYGVGRLTFGGTRAGLLAALFALGTPMIVSEMHEFLLDPQQAAMVAGSVWAALASRRFERFWLAALAGVLTGLAMLTKETSVIFIAGPLAVMFLRGGWRNWRGIAVFLVLAGAVAAPWYWYHWTQLRQWNAANSLVGTSAYLAPPRFSRESLTYYVWDALNIQLLVPLALFAAVGLVAALRGCLPRPRRDDLRPELLAGVVVSYLGSTWIIHKDPRYSLPMLIFVAVLGAGWIVQARPRVRLVATAALVVVVAVNFIGVSAGVGGSVTASLPGHTAGVIERELTFYSPDGWLRGGPGTDGNIPSLLTALRRAGVRQVTFGGDNTEDFNQSGLQVRAIEAGLTPTATYNPGELGAHGVFILPHVRVAGDPPPCRTLDDGSGVYVVLGSALQPFDDYTFICPGHKPEIYRRTAPLPPGVIAQNETQLPEPYRGRTATIMRAMRRQGVVEVEFDPSSDDVPWFASGPLAKLATAAGLTLPANYAPASLGPHDAFMVRHADGTGNPPPCLRYPDGTGLYIVLGNPVIPFSSYELYCPTRVPRNYPASSG
jgi:Dolichyl-phosphate-mannose-protein mannosyltransferase